MSSPPPEVGAGAASRWAWPAWPGGSKLEPGTIDVFAFTTDLSRSRTAELEALLSPTEIDRAGRFHFERDRRRFIAGRGRLRQLIGRHSGQHAAEVEFREGPFGKPELARGRDMVRFNASGSGGVGLVAIGLDGEIGIDVEQLRPLDDALSIAERMFPAEEHQALCLTPEPERPQAFFRAWVCKEAVVKAIGEGLSHPLTGVSLRPGLVDGVDGGTVECRRVSYWVRRLPAPCDGFVAAVAIAGGPSVVRAWSWHE